jgi:hypothetical protein
MRKLTKMEAFKLVRKLKESKQAIKFYKKEDAEEGEVYAVVTPDGGELSVTFQDGDLLVGPFSSDDAAKAAVGDDVVTVAGADGGGDVEPIESDDLGLDGGMTDDILASPENNSDMDDTKMTEAQKKIRSNMLRLRRNVVEAIQKRVKSDILRESEALDIETDVKTGDAVTDDAAGALDHQGGQIASFVNAADTGSTDLKVDASQDADAPNSDANLLEQSIGKGNLVNVFDRKTNAKVDTGMVESITAGKVKISESDEYDVRSYRFQVLAS